LSCVLKNAGFMGSVNLVAYVTAWSNRNRYSLLDVEGRM
jgi:hypothetical protein